MRGFSPFGFLCFFIVFGRLDGGRVNSNTETNKEWKNKRIPS
jgi:hypothetical protein